MEYSIDIKLQQKEFEELLLHAEAEGMPELLIWLNDSDFYRAPASTRYHGSREGGLALHSYCVYDLLKQKRHLVPELSERSIIITALLHDLCKIGVYSRTWRNVKRYTADGSRRDEGGRFDWFSEQTYTFDDPLPLGHAPKSVHLISRFIALTDMETAMILHHMGAFAGEAAARDFSAATRIWPSVALLHSADLEASYCLEDRNPEWLGQLPWVKL